MIDLNQYTPCFYYNCRLLIFCLKFFNKAFMFEFFKRNLTFEAGLSSAIEFFILELYRFCKNWFLARRIIRWISVLEYFWFGFIEEFPLASVSNWNWLNILGCH